MFHCHVWLPECWIKWCGFLQDWDVHQLSSRVRIQRIFQELMRYDEIWWDTGGYRKDCSQRAVDKIRLANGATNTTITRSWLLWLCFLWSAHDTLLWVCRKCCTSQQRNLVRARLKCQINTHPNIFFALTAYVQDQILQKKFGLSSLLASSWRSKLSSNQRWLWGCPEIWAPNTSQNGVSKPVLWDSFIFVPHY